MDDIRFVKMTGAGNDFIVIDNREGCLPEAGRGERLAAWCRRRLDIGADGVLLLEPPRSTTTHFRMRYYNADGREAESCGNGARCLARFAYLIGAAPARMAFDTLAGPYRAEVLEGGDVMLHLAPPRRLRQGLPISIEPLALERIDAIDTGVPHAVVFVRGLGEVNVDRWGREIRHHPLFAPDGTNVNFAEPLPDGRIAVRTFERGVEAETLACGTGAVAVALLAALKGLAEPPVVIQTSGGPTLIVDFALDASEDGPIFTGVRLRGEARLVYEGRLVASGILLPVATS